MDSQGKFLCCMPLRIGAIFWFLIWGIISLINLLFYFLITFLHDPILFDIGSWQDWLSLLGATAFGLFTAVMSACWLISSFRKPIAKLSCMTMVATVGGIINAIYYWVNAGTAWNNSNLDDDPVLAVFICVTIFYAVTFLSIWLQLSNIKSLVAVVKAGGTGWEKKSAPQIMSSKSLRAF